MDPQDKNLSCKECSKEFVWSAGEQKFYQDKGLQNPPGRCPDCRKKNRDNRGSQVKHSIVCKNCSKEDQVPFEPRNPNDVLCGECFSQAKIASNQNPAGVS
ncbi:MAG TPA: zinc-ribbon domain containing protein [Patescibacteria group bacterium]|nr:zinc-ribbon domain containing protein [Patescibacteria group bacterium]